MAVYIRQHPLEIPPPSEKDWLKDDEEDFFLQDPERERDALPQPVRMVTKLVMLVFDDAMEIIERRERLREAEKLKVKPTECFATAEFQVTGTATCLAVSGKYIFVGLSVGLAAFKVSDYTEVCAWDAVKTEVCAIHALDLGNEVHILFAVDEMGLVCLFCFHKESFLLIKILNEVEDISKRSTCVEVVLSPRGDYAGVLLQDSTKAWLEIYQLPKDSWLKEMEESPGAALGLTGGERRSSQASVESPVAANKVDLKLSLPVLLLTVKPPKPITGVRRQIAHCMRKGSGAIKNSFCDPATQPNGRQEKCYEKDCPPRWWAGEWQKCSTTCGPTGQKKRTVLCIQTVGSDEQALAVTECQHLLKPKTHLSCNRDILCPSDWTVSNWTECTVTCGGGIRTRNVTCAKNNKEPCDTSKRPNSKALCGLQQCPSAARFLIPPLAPRRGKIIIRKTTANPKETPPHRIPIPSLRSHTTTKVPKPESVTPCLPTSSGLGNVSEEEGTANRTLQNNFAGPSDVYNYPVVSTENSSSQNTTSWPFHNSLSTEIIKHVQNTSESEPFSTVESEVQRSEDTPISSFTSNPEITSSYDYLTEESDDMDGSLEGSEKPIDLLYSTELNPEIRTKSTTLHTVSPVLQNERMTSQPPPASPHKDPSTLLPVSRSAQGLAFPATADYIGLQVDVPVVEVINPQASVTVTPTVFGHIPRDQTDSRNETKLPETVTTSTQSSALEPALRNQSATSEGILTNVKGNSHLITSNSLPGDAYWVVGNWSECSTTCGMGAFWRHVECSSRNTSHCQHMRKPDPARKCYLRPCASWKTGNWSKCSANCNGGFKTRDVHCIDVREKRLLRPFHCQLLGYKPQINISCNTEPCLQWHVEPWNECSRTCGGGQQKRHIYCPVEGHCDWTKRPNAIAPCNRQLCTQWTNQAWGPCTVSCGGGIQQRTVECMNTETNETENDSMCVDKPKPTEYQKCGLRECRKSTGPPCSKDQLSVQFCQRLKGIGKCLLPSIQTQCCFTCSQPRIHNKARYGDQRGLRQQNYTKSRRKSPQNQENNQAARH